MAYAITDNHFLARLPQDAIERLSPGFEWVELNLGASCQLDTVDYVFFPIRGLISFVLASGNGTTSEVAVAGSESLVGLCGFLNSRKPLIPAVVRRSGLAARLPVKMALDEFRRGDAFQADVLSYIGVFFKQVAQTSLCNAQHSLEQRFCRWLLLSQDRLDDGERVAMSQELIAGMLGVRREAVTRVATHLKSRHLIDYTTRKIQIVDRDGLVNTSCECYSSLSHDYAALVG